MNACGCRAVVLIVRARLAPIAVEALKDLSKGELEQIALQEYHA